MKRLSIFILLFLPLIINAQSSTKINKYSIGLGIDLGHSFVNFEGNQNRWQGKFSPAAALNISLINRLNKQWMGEIGIGFTAFGLRLKGPIDFYIIDFASPHIFAGLTYNKRTTKGNENFFKLSGGSQLGYRSAFIDEFETYRVLVQGRNRFYHFVKPEIGIRRYFKKRMKGSKYKAAYEVGAYFRYNLKTLGQVLIQETGFEARVEPKGNIMGLFVKFVFPTGRKRIKLDEPQEEISKVRPVKILNCDEDVLESRAMCYHPRHGILIWKEGKVKEFYSICFECIVIRKNWNKYKEECINLSDLEKAILELD